MPMTDAEVERAMDAAIVAEALDWAYRQGYYKGIAAAEAFGRLERLHVDRESLGIYGDRLVFRPNV